MNERINRLYKKGNLLFLLSCLFVIFSCSHNKSRQAGRIVKKDEPKPPVTIPVNEPVIIYLDHRPSPRTIAILTKPGSSYVIKTAGVSKTIQLVPPETLSAGFFVSMQNYNTEQGLGLSSVTSSCLDKNGNLWFGTWGGGLSRYDGKSFLTYTTANGLANNVVTTIFEDKSGNLWFGTFGGGVSCFNGKSFTTYTTEHGLAGNYVWGSILEDKNGDIWFACYGGLTRLHRDGNKLIFTNYGVAQGLAANGLASLLEDENGNFWIGTWDSGISCYDGKSFINYTTKEGLANNVVRKIVEDKNGTLWFATHGGVSALDRKAKTSRQASPGFKNYTTADGLVDNNVTTIIEDKKRNLWFGTARGVSLLEPEENHSAKKRFTNFTTSEGLPNNNVQSISEDKKGNIWFSTDGGGVSRLDRDWRVLTTLTTDLGVLKVKVFSLLEDKNKNLWLGTYGDGVYRLEGGETSLFNGRTKFTHYSTTQGLINNTVVSICEDKKGNLWFGTNAGVSRLDSGRRSFTNYTSDQGLADNDMGVILEDKDENLWFCTGNGASRLDRDRNFFTNYSTQQGLLHNYIRSMLEDKNGDVWFATDSGVSRLNRDGKFFTNFTKAQGLMNNLVEGIMKDESGNLWICGHQAGITRYDGKSFINYTTENGVSDDNVGDVILGDEGTIWFATNNGFTALRSFERDSVGEKNLPPSNKLSNAELESGGFKPVFEIYNNKTGFPIKDMTSHMCLTAEGLILAGTSEKVVRFDPGRIQKDINPPKVFIQSIKINNEPVCWNDLMTGKKIVGGPIPANITEEVMVFGKALKEEERDEMQKKFSGVEFDSTSTYYPVPVNLVLPNQHNNIRFDFAAIEPAKPNLVRYQYMLEGYDKDWSPVTDMTSATFGNIHEGHYKFKLKAQSPDGIWSEPIVYTFKVLPPWHRTWWAYLIYALVLIAAIWRIHLYQKEKVIRRERERAQKKELAQAKEIEKAYHQLKETQAQLVQQEKMASLGELTAGIAHEIQNPLNFVNNFSEVNQELVRELKTEAANGNLDEVKTIVNDIASNSEKINHHGKRADAIVKGMLQHSRISSGQKEPTDINALCDEYLRLAYHGLRAKDKSFNAKIETDLDPSVGKINIVPQDIGRVILNLINNAFYEVNKRAKLQTASYEPQVFVQTKRINAKPNGDRVEIRVTDNGDGIPKNVVEKIFQPFFTTKPTGEGTGLGLSLSYDIMKAHGGQIKVETKEGEGSNFIIQLPA
jgi:signal transduction histidine kinase/ligand-binding sensor domain-containing protein